MPMLIYAVDQALRRTGLVVGEPFKPETRRVLDLMPDRSDTMEDAAANLAGVLLDFFKHVGKPDVLVCEEALSPEVFFQMREKGFSRNTPAIVGNYYLISAMAVVCKLKQVPIVKMRRQSVLKAFTGRAKWDNREDGKLQTIARCRLLKLVDSTFNDSDLADAIALHWVASSQYGKQTPTFEFYGDARL